MASVSIILKKNKIKQGQGPLYLRIIKDRRTKFVSIGIKIKESDWNEETSKVKKSHPNSARLNAVIATKVAEAENIALELTTKSKSVNAYKIKEKIVGKGPTDFFAFAEKILKRIENRGSYGTFKRTKSVIEKLKIFKSSGKLYFDEIDVSFLKEYEHYLSKELKNEPNTIHANFKIIRKIINDAVSEDIINVNDNPFLRFKLHTTKTQREYLTEDELKRIEDLKLQQGTMIDHHRNMYVLAAYAGGLRVSDILQLKWKNYDGDRLNIKVQKTGSQLNIKLPQKAIEIIELYKKNKGEYIFPVLNKSNHQSEKELYIKISSATAYINKDLKEIAKLAKIDKHISFHTSRHTWATRALRKGMRIEYVSKLMGHAAIKETQVYAKIVNEELDKAMDIFNK